MSQRGTRTPCRAWRWVHGLATCTDAYRLLASLLGVWRFIMSRCSCRTKGMFCYSPAPPEPARAFFWRSREQLTGMPFRCLTGQYDSYGDHCNTLARVLQGWQGALTDNGAVWVTACSLF